MRGNHLQDCGKTLRILRTMGTNLFVGTSNKRVTVCHSRNYIPGGTLLRENSLMTVLENFLVSSKTILEEINL